METNFLGEVAVYVTVRFLRGRGQTLLDAGFFPHLQGIALAVLPRSGERR